jgi:hypothetical protein
LRARCESGEPRFDKLSVTGSLKAIRLTFNDSRVAARF